jgi:hypothetical protein
MATKAVAAPKRAALPPEVERARAVYEAELDIVNSLRHQLTTTMEEYTRAMPVMLKTRARYVRLAKAAGVEVTQTWWEREQTTLGGR